MTVSGIIAEFNPFHNGHRYLLSQAKGLKIVAMSGNFVQRGEPAIVDKWVRTEMALKNGADLVVELPFLVTVQSADYFAQGAIDILDRLGVKQLVFGTEEHVDYQLVSQIYKEYQQNMLTYLQDLPNDLSYPQKMQKVWEHFADIHFTGATPNHILGLSYAKACAYKAIKLCPIKRQGSGFHSLDMKTTFASATSLRTHRKDTAFLRRFIPYTDLFLTSPKVTWEDYFPLLKYQLMVNTTLTDIFQMNQELSSRILSAMREEVTTIDDLVDKVATKRYTKARVRRLLTYTLVGAKKSALPDAIHVLGFTSKGQEHLRKIKKSVHIVTRIGENPWDIVTQQADHIYRLGNPKLHEQNWGKIPVMLPNR